MRADDARVFTRGNGTAIALSFASMVGRFFGATLPNSRTRAVSVLVLFAMVQIADAVMTFAGVSKFGLQAEGNAVLLFYMMMCGAGATLTGAKLLAITLATVLHLRSYYTTLAILTVVYVLGAIAPWMWASTF